MMKKLLTLFCCIATLSAIAQHGFKADKPIFVDPIEDGAADPAIVFNRNKNKYFMFYTNRRAKTENLGGVAWVHGTKIGMASSINGAHWKYEGTCTFEGFNEIPENEITYWAPDVVYHKGLYHMYVTIVPGIFEGWYHPRFIAHYTSKNLTNWKFQSKLTLASERCIDASVFQLPNGNWRMYYNNENDNKSMYYADSPNLYDWKDCGKKVIDTRGEGAKIFQWKGTNWMIIDSWKGLSVFQSDDLEHWHIQEKRILETPGTGKDDAVKGGHADVIVQDDKAYIFYFTHPGRTPENNGIDNHNTRRSVIQIAALTYTNGVISCDRNKNVSINLNPIK
ncbi:Glycosyl hydrolases family 43 [Pustulibacterium marinum]|uniref:Glycosyl hydrolases family 43 n=2 Tax=Pustulibacterium marinum TaxID=1224947 RepID=A0A1I7FS09_9FLAO|nr:Glycosyl hydrolases family 43 [Pustulibacterium marinum]